MYYNNIALKATHMAFHLLADFRLIISLVKTNI